VILGKSMAADEALGKGYTVTMKFKCL